jgi:hypothetical protein
MEQPDEVQLFKTAFVRPERIRFESWYLFPGGIELERSLAQADGEVIRAWRQGRTIAPPKAFLVALGGPYIHHNILGLLLPKQITTSWLPNLIDLEILGEEELDDRLCYRLQCRCAWWDLDNPEVQHGLELIGGREIVKSIEQEQLALWLDKQTLLVRRLEHRLRNKYEGWARETHTIATYQPETNVPIPESEVQFDPPAQTPA